MGGGLAAAAARAARRAGEVVFVGWGGGRGGEVYGLLLPPPPLRHTAHAPLHKVHIHNNAPPGEAQGTAHRPQGKGGQH